MMYYGWQLIWMPTGNIVARLSQMIGRFFWHFRHLKSRDDLNDTLTPTQAKRGNEARRCRIGDSSSIARP